MEAYIVGLFVTVVGAWMSSVEYRMKSIAKDVEKKASKKEMHEFVELSEKDIRALQEDIRQDLRRLEDKLDRLLQK